MKSRSAGESLSRMKSITKNSVIVNKISRGKINEEYSVNFGVRLILVYGISCESDVTISSVVHLAGEGATALIVGLVSGSGNSHIKMNTLQHHKAAKTTSNLFVKSVLEDRSAFDFQGSIVVDKSAQQTNAYQRNENLLLDEHSRATSSPVLEILANNVHCTHGAVVKTIDENELWYLSTRGIDRQAASDMIVAGFLKSALDLVSDKDTRRQIEQKIL